MTCYGGRTRSCSGLALNKNTGHRGLGEVGGLPNIQIPYSTWATPVLNLAQIRNPMWASIFPVGKCLLSGGLVLDPDFKTRRRAAAKPKSHLADYRAYSDQVQGPPSVRPPPFRVRGFGD